MQRKKGPDFSQYFLPYILYLALGVERYALGVIVVF